MTTKLSPFHSADHTYCASYTNTPLYPYTPYTVYREFLTVSNSTMATAPTWVQVARKKKTPAFLPTECAVNLEQFAAPLCLPPSSSHYSAFVPLPSGYKQGWAESIVASIPMSAVGIVPRADISLLEVCFANKEAQQDFLSTPFASKHVTVHPVPPAGTPSAFVPIKLMNVPVLASLVVEQQLRSFWSPHGEVVALAPHTYRNTPLQSNRWDLVLKLPAGKALSATPLFDILGFKVMASWPGSDKACPRCKLVGHDSRTCPKRPTPKKTKRRSSSSSKQPATSAVKTVTLRLASSFSPVAVPQITADKDSPISDPTTNTDTSMDTEGYTPVVSNSQKRKRSKAAKQSSSSSAPPVNLDAPNPNPSLPDFPFVLSPEQVEQLSTLTEMEWMSMARTAQESFDDEAVNAFMDSPSEHIIASFKSAIDHYRAHPIPTSDTQ